MPLVRCSGCGERPENKLTSTTWSWRRADGVRKAYRSRLCVSCFASKVAPMDKDYGGVDRLTCPNCHIDTEDDMDPIYTTNYLPAYGEYKTEAPFCGACAAVFRVWIQEHSQELEDQSRATGGPRPDIDANELLQAFGLGANRAAVED